MCRLAYITQRFPHIEQWFNQLERSLGGHGNGVAIGEKRIRGVDLTNKKIAAWVYSTDQPVLYHTRLASVGDQTDLMCHPFRCGGGWLAHNGTWQHGAVLAAQVGDGCSDTMIMASLIARRFSGNFSRAMKVLCPRGVWLWMHKGRLSVHKDGGQLYYSSSLGAWGSEPPDRGGDWYAVADGDYGSNDIPQRQCEIVRERMCLQWPTNGEAMIARRGYWWDDDNFIEEE